jgi:hypothetical protein
MSIAFEHDIADFTGCGPIGKAALFQFMMRRDMQTRCHHIDGYWRIGRMPDYGRANLDFAEIFR